jgi:hypothetical protein
LAELEITKSEGTNANKLAADERQNQQKNEGYPTDRKEPAGIAGEQSVIAKTGKRPRGR